MNLEQLLDCSADELEKMTDAELLEHFKPYLTVTRPELITRIERKTVADTLHPEKANEIRQKCAKLRAMGIDVDEKAMLKNIAKRK